MILYNNFKDGKYHKECSWHDEFENIKFYVENFDISFSKHVKDRLHSNIKRDFNFKDISINKLINSTIFEVTINKNQIIRFGCRFSYKNDYLVVIFAIEKNELICITGWINKKDDIHFTLNRNEYIQDYNYKEVEKNGKIKCS